MIEPVRVLLCEMPRLLRDILEHAVQAHSDCELWRPAKCTLHTETDQAVAPDAVILGLMSDEDATLVPALFARWPKAHVMTLMPKGEGVTVYELRPYGTILGQMPPAEIVQRLSEAVNRSRKS